jgi:tRNA (mo5U34)-methyltransferase
MNMVQRFARARIDKGLPGLFRYAYRKYLGDYFYWPRIRRKNEQLSKTFKERAKELNYWEEVKDYIWYHAIDLGNGLVTPGPNDYRAELPSFGFPSSMKGMNALDVGSATGFFAFEFERRGADVTSVDIPSYEELDRFPGENPEPRIEGLRQALDMPEGTSLADIYRLAIDRPFNFCHRVLHSKVHRVHSSIYDLSREKLGNRDFDFVFLGDILLHLTDPIRALTAVAPLCRGTLVISQTLPKYNSAPLLLYVGGEKPDAGLVWWHPNQLCLEQILKKMGFKKVVKVGQLSYARPQAQSIIHASR